MDFAIPAVYQEELERFQSFLDLRVTSEIFNWYREGVVPRSFFHGMAEAGWYNFRADNGRLDKLSALRWALFMERLASISPGLAVMVLAHVDLGTTALWLFGSDDLKEEYGTRAVRGETLLCLGSTESHAGSDAAGISTLAEKVDGGWSLSGTKAYVTGGMTGDYGVITAITDAQAPRSSRLSMFLVDLSAPGVRRKKLSKQVWIPADLAQVRLENVFVPDGHLMGSRGQGLQQVLTVFTYSRVPISALTMGTAAGAFDKGLEHARKRELFGKVLIEFQAKQFEAADLHARMESARLSLWKACWAMDSGQDFRMESSIAKYLCVKIAQEVAVWAADLFGQSPSCSNTPFTSIPMDAWASSLGEGTQDVQKLMIFRELMKRFG